MSEQEKQKEVCACDAQKGKCGCKVGKVIVGLILIVLGLMAVLGWWQYLWSVVKGCIGPFLILAGAITIAISKE